MSPGITRVGTNTASSTSVVATTAPPTWCMAFDAASLGGNPSSSMMRIVFSTTTMASSTTMPMARINPNRLRLLIDRPAASMTENVPIRETGIAMAGIRVARKSCRKMNTTRTTRTIAMMSVVMTSLMDCLMYRVVS